VVHAILRAAPALLPAPGGLDTPKDVSAAVIRHSGLEVNLAENNGSRFEVRSRSLPYIAPFLAYIALLAVEKYLPIPPTAAYGLRVVIVTVVLLTMSRSVLSFRPVNWIVSVAVGLAVFIVWVAPDVLISNYREHWMFRNPFTGEAASSLPEGLRTDAAFLALRVAGSSLLVPVIEELFWRAWMMRWLIDTNFERLPLGTWSAFSFWLVAVLFATEHGPYWEVGLLAGIIYNWLMIKSKRLGDCILAHAVTNFALAVYIIARGQYQYWL
jgi:CAAX prenyl protease-like protein